MLDAELEAEFFKDLVLAPSRIVGAHAADEVDVLARNLGPADLLGARLPAPIEFEALAVPSDDGLSGLTKMRGVFQPFQSLESHTQKARSVDRSCGRFCTRL